MKKIACKDLNPMTSCMFEATGKTVNEVTDKMLAHMKMEHKDEVAKMGMSDEEMVKMIGSKVHY